MHEPRRPRRKDWNPGKGACTIGISKTKSEVFPLTRTSPLRASERKRSGAHFTPPDLASLIAERVFAAAGGGTPAKLTVLDPSCGDGELLLAMSLQVPASMCENVRLVGVEFERKFLERARTRLSAQPCSVELIHGDFLEMVLAQHEPLLWEARSALSRLPGRIDAVIANPPYVRTQMIGSRRAQELASSFGLAGRVDLYHAFFIAITACLTDGGHLGIVTSNRYLTTRGGEAVRAFLSRHYEILEIVDLGDTKLFAAAVLPALFFAKKRGAMAPARDQRPLFLRVYEDLESAPAPHNEADDAPSVIDIVRRRCSGTYEVAGKRYSVGTGRLSIPVSPSELWTMVTGEEHGWIEKMNASGRRLSEIARVRVGIKTTADSVFIRSDWQSLPAPIRPEEDLLKPLLSHEDCRPWRHQTNGRRRILYTHEIRHGRRQVIDFAQFPRALAYLESHRQQLERRSYIAGAGRQWFEIWVPQDPSAWQQPKIVFPDISPMPEFLLDADGCLVDGNCYWMTLVPGVDHDVLFLVMALCNSRLMTRYHDLSFQNRLYSGRRRYLTQYVGRYPLPDLHAPACEGLVRLGKKLAGEDPTASGAIEAEEEIERLVASAFGVEALTHGA